MSALEQAMLDGLRVLADAAEEGLRSAVAEMCPGEHKPRQHRDAKSPWCPACKRTARGEHKDDIESTLERRQRGQ